VAPIKQLAQFQFAQRLGPLNWRTGQGRRSQWHAVAAASHGGHGGQLRQVAGPRRQQLDAALDHGFDVGGQVQPGLFTGMTRCRRVGRQQQLRRFQQEGWGSAG
jgi:hypothetical protein